MSRESRDVWIKRVERWQASDLTAKEFASEIGVKAGTLSYWKWRLGNEARASSDPKSKAPVRRSASQDRKQPGVSFAEVLLTGERPSSSIEIVLDARRVVRVGGAFDGETLVRVLDILEARP